MIRRGQFVLVALAGDYGKPRHALVIQSDLFTALPAVTICPLSSCIRDDAEQFRLDVLPTANNGLQKTSQINIDKITAVPTAKIGPTIGTADGPLMSKVNRALALFLAIF